MTGGFLSHRASDGDMFPFDYVIMYGADNTDLSFKPSVGKAKIRYSPLWCAEFLNASTQEGYWYRIISCAGVDCYFHDGLVHSAYLYFVNESLHSVMMHVIHIYSFAYHRFGSSLRTHFLICKSRQIDRNNKAAHGIIMFTDNKLVLT